MGLVGKILGGFGLAALLLGCGGAQEKAASPARPNRLPSVPGAAGSLSSTRLVVGLPVEQRGELELAVKAEHLFTRACNAGIPAACEQAQKLRP